MNGPTHSEISEAYFLLNAMACCLLAALAARLLASSCSLTTIPTSRWVCTVPYMREHLYLKQHACIIRIIWVDLLSLIKQVTSH